MPKSNNILPPVDKDILSPKKEKVYSSGNIQQNNKILIRYLLDKTLRYLNADLEKETYIPLKSEILNVAPQLIQILMECYVLNNNREIDQVTLQLNEVLSFFHKLEK